MAARRRRPRIEQAEAGATSRVARDETLLVVVGRGASDPDANSNVCKVTRLLWEGFGFGWAEVCYSGVTFPLVGPGLEHAAKLGYRRIIVFPYFLFTGVLVKRIYRMPTSSPSASGHRVPQGAYLNDHPPVVDTFADRIEEMMDGETAMNCQLCKYRDAGAGLRGRGRAGRKRAITITSKASAPGEKHDHARE